MFVQNHALASYTLSRFRCTSVPPVFWLLVLLVGLVWTMRWTPALAAAPEIDLYYTGGPAIGDGSTTPQTYDCTDFSVANVDGVGLSCQYQLYNSGDADLENVAVTIIGAQKDDFSLDYSPDASITPGASTFFQVTFYPKGTGTRRATIRIASNDSDETPYDFAIQGTAAPAELDISCSHTGAAIPNGSTTPATTDCTDFGNANVDGYVGNYQFGIYNTGNDALRDVTVTVTGAGAEHFAFSDPYGVGYAVAPGSSSYFYLGFTPKSAGVHQATVSIASNDSDENPYTFVIQGTATPGEIAIRCYGTNVVIPNGSTTPSTNDCTDLGNANVDSASAIQYFYIDNTGNDSLRDIIVTITGADADNFTFSDASGGVIAPQSTSYFQLTYTPKAAGVHQATVSIASSDSDESPYTFVIQGTATPAEIQVNYYHYEISNGDRSPMREDCTDFGAVEVNQQVTCVFTIYNQGNDYLRNVSVAITGTNATVFYLPYQPGDTIAPGSYAQFHLYFHSQTVGLQKATVSISNSDSDENPYTFAIQGKATGPLTISMTAEPPTPARNFRFTTNSRGSLGSSFLLDSDLYHSQWDTDGDGIWNTKTSNGVAAGNYHVTAQLPFLWGVYGIDCDNPALMTRVGPSINFNLAGSTGLSCTYQLKRSALIRVQSFHDQNGNGRRNTTEPFLPNWRFTLRNSNGAVIQALTTNDLGKGTFTDLLAGDYTICVEVLDGWINTTPSGTPACYTRSLTWGNALTLNFGNRASSLSAAEAEGSAIVATPNEVLTTPDDAELSEGDQVWLTTAEPTEPTDVTQSQRLYLPAVLR